MREIIIIDRVPKDDEKMNLRPNVSYAVQDSNDHKVTFFASVTRIIGHQMWSTCNFSEIFVTWNRVQYNLMISFNFFPSVPCSIAFRIKNGLRSPRFLLLPYFAIWLMTTHSNSNKMPINNFRSISTGAIFIYWPWSLFIFIFTVFKTNDWLVVCKLRPPHPQILGASEISHFKCDVHYSQWMCKAIHKRINVVLAITLFSFITMPINKLYAVYACIIIG